MITVYANVTPSGAGSASSLSSGAYGAVGSIAAIPALGYDFSMWSGNCPISDVYERTTTLTLSPVQGTACRIVAAFVPGTTNCGSAGKPCCLNSTCSIGAACNSSGMCAQTNSSFAPDLAVTGISLPSQVTVGVRVYGSIVTQNLGNAQAQNSTTSYYIDGAIVNSVSVPALAAGGSDSEAASFICEHAGSHTFSASADANGNITEKNETNNGKSLAFSCT